MAEISVKENVALWGVGELNVDACRVKHNEECKPMKVQSQEVLDGMMFRQGGRYKETTELKPEGRWPTNVVFSHNADCSETECTAGCPISELDKQSGTLKSGERRKGVPSYVNLAGGKRYFPQDRDYKASIGGASRFFPTFRETDMENATVRNDGETRLYLGDCLTVLRNIEDNTLDAVITDPPAGIGFMGKKWDSDRGGRDAWISWFSERMAEVHRVLKPGAWGLVWALPKTSHWTGYALEEAGFIVEDRVSHLFGTGFPKNKGTQLKPACEDWWLIRKQRSERNVKANVERWGTGELNTDACRLDRAADDVPGWHKTGADGAKGYQGQANFRIRKMDAAEIQERCSGGRWPSNVVLSHNPDCEEIGTKEVKSDTGFWQRPGYKRSGGLKGESRESFTPQDDPNAKDGKETVTAWRCTEGCPVAELDRQSGIKKGTAGIGRHTAEAHNRGYSMNKTSKDWETVNYGDIGGASRFFYCSKPSRRERDLGCDSRNHHPTIKSLSLMRWLIRLITPEGGTIVDPFLGSATTLLAAMEEGYNSLGIENEAEYFPIAKARVRHTAERLGYTVRTYGGPRVYRLPVLGPTTPQEKRRIVLPRVAR
jgi:DNA modification methylase